MSEVNRPPCTYCDKEIWAISHIKYTIGVELPALLHMDCYNRLKEIESSYEDLQECQSMLSQKYLP